MNTNKEVIITPELKDNIKKAIIFLTDKINGKGYEAKSVAKNLKITQSLISDLKNGSKTISRPAINNGIIDLLINMYGINSEFIYKGTGKIIRTHEKNIVSEPHATYGNNKEVECLKKDIQLLELENKHLKEAAYLKDEFIAQLKENKAYLESQLAKSGIKSGI